MAKLVRIETLQTGRAIREMTAQVGRLPEWLYVVSDLIEQYKRY